MHVNEANPRKKTGGQEAIASSSVAVQRCSTGEPGTFYLVTRAARLPVICVELATWVPMEQKVAGNVRERGRDAELVMKREIFNV